MRHQDTSVAGADAGSEIKINESLSQFLARVLDQLSITAWLPAVAVVGVAVVLSQLARTDGSATEAFAAIGDMGFATIILLMAGVVVVTMFTQAFEFEAIRTIEGYWRPGGPVGAFARWRCSRHRSKRTGLLASHAECLRTALESTRQPLRDDGYGAGVFDALESYVLNVPMTKGASEADKAEARKLAMRWKTFADPHRMQRIEALERRIEEYPDLEHRVLPTRLGNVVRAVEDRVHDPSQGRLENFAIHVLDDLPRSIARAYREQRRRLDLYCGLVFVLGAAFAPSVALALSYQRKYRVTGAVVPGVLVLLTYVSYRAALASGRKFGLAVTAIKEDRNRLSAKRDAPRPTVASPT